MSFNQPKQSPKTKGERIRRKWRTISLKPHILQKGRRSTTDKKWSGVVKFIGIKGKVIDIPTNFTWICPPVVPAEGTSTSVAPALQSQKKPFEDKECYDTLFSLAKEFCGRGEKVQGIIICQKNGATIIGSRENCFSNILRHDPPHVTIIIGDGLLRKCTFQFWMLLTW